MAKLTGRRHIASPVRQPFDRPLRRFGHHRSRIVRQRAQVGEKSRIAAVARGDGGVADHAVAADALDRGAGENLAEPRVIKVEQIGERGRGKLRPANEGAVGGGGLGELVPGADRQAIVAAIDAVADPFAQRFRDRPLCSMVR